MRQALWLLLLVVGCATPDNSTTVRAMPSRIASASRRSVSSTCSSFSSECDDVA